MKRYLTLLLVSSICFVHCIKLSAQEPLTSPYLDSAMAEIMETGHLAGVSACIIKAGEVKWIGNYGYANIEQQIPVDTTTLFYMASVSKTVVATALMQLWEMGLFDLDDDVNDYLPFDFHNPYHPSYPITFRMLCTHTSSIKDNDAVDPYYWGEDSPIPLGQFMYDYFDPDGAYYNPSLNFYNQVPGTGYHYSNVGAALVGYLVEVLGDSTFWYQTKERIFDPLQMNESAWFISQVDTSNLAMPYYWNGSTHVPYGYYAMTTYPAGTLRTSVNQLAQFLMAYMNGGTWMGEQILQSSTIDTIMTAQIPNINSTGGLFWYKKYLGGRWLWGHEGINLGAMTSMRFYPEENTGVIIFSNTADEIGYEIIDLLFDYAEDSIPCSCLPEGIWFSSQLEVDNFQTDYPGCTEIIGGVYIGGDPYNPSNITSLEGLNMINSIGESLYIGFNENLTSLSGLDNLTFVGGDLSVQWNQALSNLSGLENLSFIGVLFIQDNSMLMNLTGLEGLNVINGDIWIESNSSITSLSGLNNLSSINGSFLLAQNQALNNLSGLENLTAIGGLSIQGNHSLNNLAGLEGIEYIGGDLGLLWCSSLTSLTGLNNLISVNGNLTIYGTEFSDFTGLENLESIAGILEIHDFASMQSFTGLNNLTSIGGLSIRNNLSLVDLSGFDKLDSIGGSFRLINVESLKSLSGIDQLKFIGGDIEIGGNDSLTNIALPGNITSIYGDLEINYNNSLPSLTGLEGITSIGHNLEIKYNNSLISLTGLDNLESIGRGLYVWDNSFLINFSGLENLSYIGRKLDIQDNDSLSDFNGFSTLKAIGDKFFINNNGSLKDFAGLDSLHSIGSYIYIKENNSLTSLKGLDSLHTIGSFIAIKENNSLTNLKGLDNIIPTSINGLYIYENPNLGFCHVKSVCDYLSFPGGSIDIHSNAPGCNSPEEVMDSCNITTINEKYIQQKFSIYPNPSYSKLNVVIATLPSENNVLNIFNTGGQQLLEEKFTGLHKEIDISNFPKGIYFVKIKNENGVMLDKIIKQ